MEEITYRRDATVTIEQVIELFRSSGIRRPIDQPERIGRMLQHANLTLTAWDEDKLVGIARALTDFSFCCYLSDLAVAQSYQRRGIGKELIRQLHEASGDEPTLLLIAAPAAMTYYPHIGLQKVDRAWALPPRRVYEQDSRPRESAEEQTASADMGRSQP
jgi:GNAT superfamily N-acetyltransferase